MPLSKKQAVLEELFAVCRERGDFIFDNDLVREIAAKHHFGNPFDATKVDNSSLLPPSIREAGYFILHLGKGRHRFVHGLDVGYHRFEEISPEEVFDWRYRISVLNEADSSESNVLSVASNQRIIHDFLYNDIVASPKVYFPRRTKRSITFWVGDTKVETRNLQMEIDLTMEYLGVVTVFECKNGFPSDFATYQLFFPFLYYTDLRDRQGLAIREVNCCYILRGRQEGRSVLRLYRYTFTDPTRMDSIRLDGKAEYRLVRR